MTRKKTFHKLKRHCQECDTLNRSRLLPKGAIEKTRCKGCGTVVVFHAQFRVA